jgi:hypothetical protein
MSEEEVQVNPRELVSQFRRNYVNAHAVKRQLPNAFRGAKLHTLKEKPLKEADLPQEIRSLLMDYRKAHPRSKLTLLKYQQIENGNPVLIVEDEDVLPDESRLLTLSQTVTLNTSAEVRVITRIVIASVETI